MLIEEKNKKKRTRITIKRKLYKQEKYVQFLHVIWMDFLIILHIPS